MHCVGETLVIWGSCSFHVYDHTAINRYDVLIGCVVLSLAARVSDIDFNSLLCWGL